MTRSVVALLALAFGFGAVADSVLRVRATATASEAYETCRPPRRRPHSRRRRPPPRRRPPRPVVTQAYIRMRTRWHRAPSATERRAWLAQPTPPLVLRPVGGGASVSLIPSADGTFGPEALASARAAFADRHDGQSTDVHPRLLELCYRAARQFRAPYVYLVSGYRTTRATSRHNQGRAMDIVMPGVPDERLATFLRQQGFVGVGTYPTSGFTHLDVRARSYYWVDRSGPNQENQTTPVRANEIARNDSAARRRGERQVADLVPTAAEGDEERPSEAGGE